MSGEISVIVIVREGPLENGNRCNAISLLVAKALLRESNKDHSRCSTKFIKTSEDPRKSTKHKEHKKSYPSTDVYTITWSCALR